MRIKALAVFGLSYAVMLVGSLTLSLVAVRLLEWDATNDKAMQNIGFILNIVAFFVATTAATSRKLHDILGGASGPITFRGALAKFQYGMAVGIALLAIVVDFCIYVFSSWYFTGEVLMPSPLRAAALAAVYGVFAWVAIRDRAVKTRGYGQR